MTTLEVLVGARKLIALPEHWTQNAFARTLEGNPTATLSPRAVCWCSIGAIYKVSSYHSHGALAALKKVARTSFFTYNDNHTHAEVLSMFDRAIQKEAK